MTLSGLKPMVLSWRAIGRIVDPRHFTMIHFHGNGEAVADYVPFMADVFADMGLNSLFVEYREYGGSTGQAEARCDAR